MRVCNAVRRAGPTIDIIGIPRPDAGWHDDFMNMLSSLSLGSFFFRRDKLLSIIDEHNVPFKTTEAKSAL